MFLPALCRKMGVPYCIVKNKSLLEEFAEGRPLPACSLQKNGSPILHCQEQISSWKSLQGRPLLALLSLLLTPMTEALCLSLLKPSRQTTTRGLRRSENTGEVVLLAPNPQPRLLRSRRPRQRKPP